MKACKFSQKLGTDKDKIRKSSSLSVPNLWVFFFVFGLILLTGCSASGPKEAGSVIPAVSAVPQDIRQEYKLSPFYQKYLDAHGLPVVGSTNVSDYAMREAVWIITHMLELHPEVLRVMGTNGARLVVMANNEYTTDLPEQADRRPKVFQDRRSRGLGGRVCSCAEENLLCFPNDPYSLENILVHEFGHAIAGVGMRAIDSTFNQRLQAAYRKATAAGLYKGTYAGSNPAEYWAEGVQDWFDNNRENDAQHNWVNTRAELKQYDPSLAELCNEVFGEVPWRYKKPMDRPKAERAHLAGFDHAKAPRFKWREYPITEKPRVVFQTEMGEIEAELYTKQAPFAVTNLLRYVLEGYFRNGEFFRALTLENQPANAVKIQAIQVQADPSKKAELFSPIPLERTRDTGLKHQEGTLSMVPAGANTARDSFFICTSDQPELDFGGKASSDGQGFAAFGKVIRGMELVRKIQALPAEGQMLKPPLRIQGAYRME
jgi:cyclophilin family peptidyl-prolyl cis-trans isomerase